jgi:hypothetical protein
MEWLARSSHPPVASKAMKTFVVALRAPLGILTRPLLLLLISDPTVAAELRASDGQELSG